MENLKPGARAFLLNGLGYVAGAVVGYLAIYLFGQFGLASWLFNLVGEDFQLGLIPTIQQLMKPNFPAD